MHIIGAGGHAKVVIALLRALDIEVVAAWDDAPGRFGAAVLGVPVRGTVGECPAAEPVVLAIGDNRVRARVAEQEREYVTAVHPAAWVDASARLGAGTVVLATAVVQPDATVGRHAIVNIGAALAHDGRVGDFAHLSGGVMTGGGVEIGAGALLGVGAVVKPGIAVGAWATVGAGAVVVKAVAPGDCVVGNPARPLRRDSEPAG